jgi:hypothetical protein
MQTSTSHLARGEDEAYFEHPLFVFPDHNAELMILVLMILVEAKEEVLVEMVVSPINNNNNNNRKL